MEVGQSKKDEGLVVEISKDRMYGIISFTPPENGGKTLNYTESIQILKSKGITHGVDEETLKKIIEEKQYYYKYIIAKGKAPIPGQDAKITFHFDHENLGRIKPKEKEDGTVDFKELNLVINVTEGTVLATKIPLVPSEDGYNVMGQTVRCTKAKDIRMPKGKNTHISSDGLSIIASIDGQLCYDDHNIYISPNYFISKDVDSSVGNVDFLGNVVVGGSVKSGFTIKSGGNVEVKGPVEDATIIADGDIILWYGIQGGDLGRLCAKGNIIAKFIQNATVSAGGSIITEAIMHSHVSADDSIQVDKGKGLIVGGNIVAGQWMNVNILGSPMSTNTNVQIGVSPETLKKHKEICKTYKELRENCHKTDKNIMFLQAKGDIHQNPQKQLILNKLLEAQKQQHEALQKTKSEYDRINENIRNVDSGVIKVKDTLYPGVKIIIGTGIKYIKEEHSFCSITKKGVDIVIGLY